MNTLRNLAKKAVAVGSGVVMLGATAVGALAQTTTATTTLDLASYPAPFVTKGTFDGLIVIGENAKAVDNLGAVEIMGGLQAASTTPVGTGSTGSSTTTTLSGDVKQIASSGDMLEIGEAIGDVVESLTEDDLELLKDGSVTTQSGTTDFEQTLRLNSGTDSGKVVLDENNDKDTGVYLFWEENDVLFEYTLDFTSGLESNVDSQVAEDIEDESIYMLGNYYTIVNAAVPAADEVTLELIAGDVTDTLAEGETATYTIDGKDYEISVLVIGTSSSTVTVKFSINGEVTDAMEDGDTETLSDGLEIGVRDIIETTAYREGDPSSIVEFYLGANKVEIVDSDVTADDDGADIEINSENIEDARADISGTATTTDVRINSISYGLDVDSAYQTDIYLAEGEGVRAALDEAEGMIGNWDIVFQGTSEPDMTDLTFNSEGDDQYNLVFTNLRGQEFDVPFAYAGTTAASDGTYGDEDDGFFFTERGVTNSTLASPNDDTEFQIGLDDYFGLTDVGATGTADNGDDSYVLQFTDVDEDDSTLSFENLGDGSEVKATYTNSTGGTDLLDTPTAPATGDITIGGKDFSFWVYEDVPNSYRLSVDMDNSGALENSSVLDLVIKGGGILTLTNSSDAGAVPAADQWAGGMFNVTLTTDADDVDSDVNQVTMITVTETTDELDVDFDSANTGGTGVFYYDDDSDADTETALNGYGTWFKKTNDDDESDDLTVSYPEEQVEAMVYITGGEVKKSTTTSGGTGGTRINKISVGSAVLDKDVTYDQDNMIVVGGPCVNTMAAALMNNPADCAEGFTEGHATLHLFDTGKNTALLVAGYTGQDTQGAARVLAEYGDYDLKGDEMDVVVESLTNIMVK